MPKLNQSRAELLDAILEEAAEMDLDLSPQELDAELREDFETPIGPNDLPLDVVSARLDRFLAEQGLARDLLVPTVGAVPLAAAARRAAMKASAHRVRFDERGTGEGLRLAAYRDLAKRSPSRPSDEELAPTRSERFRLPAGEVSFWDDGAVVFAEFPPGADPIVLRWRGGTHDLLPVTGQPGFYEVDAMDIHEAADLRDAVLADPAQADLSWT